MFGVVYVGDSDFFWFVESWRRREGVGFDLEVEVFGVNGRRWSYLLFYRFYIIRL